MFRTILAVIAATTVLVGCKPQTSPPPAASQSAPPAQTVPAITELQKTDVTPGIGEPIANGQTAVVHYTGWLYDPSAPDHKGLKFDSSRDRGQPFRFPIGGGRVIAGWDQGVLGMKAGGQRLLVIPSQLGYGEGGGGPIPPNATLLFEVELLGIE
ncbi:MAG TPA: FKBP-type peptidyl-prolyl cis-trans isomerase [Steroidobacteraceae bacterium]|jgi:FKBP-type peptidyl-prolyl cis-trans isomerase FkpA